MARVGVIFGGRSVEHRVSVTSARTIVRGLADAGHEPVPLGVAEDGCWVDREHSQRAIAGAAAAISAQGRPIAETLHHLLDAGIEVAFPIIHGTWGEDGALQGLFEMLDLPYVGTGVTSSALAMDKLAAKRVLGAAGVPVIEYRAFSARRFEADPAGCLAEVDFPLPVFVKPSVGGSSVGVRKVKRREELEDAIRFALRFDEAVLVERGVVGRELECAVLGGRELEASCVGEIVPGAEFYDYADKYLSDAARLIAPAPLPAPVEMKLRRLAVEAFGALGGWGMARVDFFLEGEDRLSVNEINTLPGFTSISMYPRLWGLTGLPLPRLLGRLVAIAFERHRERHELDAGIKRWIAELA